MLRSLRSRLFAAILGAVLLAVGASLALGIFLTKDAVRDTIRRDVARQAETFATQLPRLPVPGRGAGAAIPQSGGAGGGPPGAPPGGPGPNPIAILTPAQAAATLPGSAAEELRSDGAAEGTAEIGGQSSIFAARRRGRAVVLVTRPDVVSGGDFNRYLSALLIASGAAALLAAALAALLARRLTQPLRRLGAAAGELAAGRSPEPVPPEGTRELDDLALAFNEMSSQLGLARDAERAVLLNVSHDLRTPLTSIRGYAEGVEDGTVKPAEAARVIGREAERLERLVGDLLALARLRQGVMEVRREPVDLGAVCRDAEERLRPVARAAGVELEVSGEGDALADHGRSLQVVTNLAENAIRVSPEGGTVALAAGPGEVAVDDQGPGIPAEELPHAFERFRLREVAGRGSPDGAGLGLAIVRELSEAMGGSVEVENLPSQGARFTVRLPR